MTSFEENKAYLDQLVAEHQIAETTIKTYWSEINTFLNEHFLCNPKTTLKSCRQKTPGYEMILVYENGQFYQKMVPCAHQEKQLEIAKTLKLFYYVNFDPLTPASLLFPNKTLKTQREFYLLDKEKDYNQIKEFITDKTEFEEKSKLVKKFLQQMESKNVVEKGVYLVGTMGIGKTILLKFLTLIAATKYQKTVAFTTVNELINKLKEGFDDSSVNINKFLNELKQVDLLVLDDLGSEQVTKWSRDEVLFFLLNYRMENKKLTYFTSNLTWSELEKHYLQINEKDPNNKIKVNRLLERIKTLAQQFVLKGEDHRY